MAVQGKHQKNVTEDMATTSTPGPSIHRIQINAMASAICVSIT